jgi:tetraprenyl-beta-curcumene synthase
VSREAADWETRALRIPDAPLRDAALTALRTKRGHTDGAALFTILTRRRDDRLLRLLVAFEIIWDYLDSVHEPVPTEANGRQLHLALVDALDPERPTSDWYRHHPFTDDGGYLAALVQTCRDLCLQLPSFDRVRAAVLRETTRAQVLALNHIPDAGERDALLRRWAAAEFPDERELAWFELSGAASASLVVHVLLALAADPGCRDHDVGDVYAAYWPWISLATTMLDSYVDQAEDRANGNHSYVTHYLDDQTAILRIQLCIQRSAAAARELRRGELHAVIVASMVAMYLSKDSARAPELQAATRDLARAGGSLTLLLLPILRLWRIRYRQQSA